MKLFIMLMILMGQAAWAESPCDIRLGTTAGVRVIEYATGNVVHSKISLKEMSVLSLKEELVSLQDMSICEESTTRAKCVLKYEKKKTENQLTLYRGKDRWLSWSLKGKAAAEKFVKILQGAGFCS